MNRLLVAGSVALLLALAAPQARGDDGAVRRAEEAYLAGDAAAAAEAWAGLLDGGARCADVYYNLGNALYLQGEVAHAILSWRIASLLAPRDGDVKANLEHVRKRLKDRLDADSGPGALFWRSTFSPSEQLWLAAGLIGLLGVLGIARTVRPGLPVQIPAALLAVPALLLTTSSVVELRELDGSPGAVVLAAEVEATSTGDGGTTLFVLHAGAEVVALQEVGGRRLVLLPDGRRGWVPSATLGIVDPRKALPLPGAAPR